MAGRFGMLAAALLVAAPGLAFAQGGDAEWQKLVAAARAEGQIVMNAVGTTHRDFLAREWPKAHPEITLTMNSIPAPQIRPRMSIERGAGKYLWDLVFTGSVVAYQLKDAGFLDPFVPELVLPDVKDPKTWGGWDSALFDKESKYVFATRAFLKMPYYNAKLLAPDKVKRLGRNVFLDPELKGKILWHDPLVPGSGETYAPVLLRLLGENGLRQLVTEQAAFTANMMDLIERMARGQYAIGMGPTMDNHLARYKKAGLDLDIRPLGNTPEFAAYGNTGSSNVVVIKGRPHPNATRLFLNWYVSKPVATELARQMGEDTRRTDVPGQVSPASRRVPGVTYWEPQREEFQAEVRASHDLIRKARSARQ